MKFMRCHHLALVQAAGIPFSVYRSQLAKLFIISLVCLSWLGPVGRSSVESYDMING